MPASEARDFAEKVLGELETLDAASFKEKVQKLLSLARDFLTHINKGSGSASQSIEDLEEKKRTLEAELTDLQSREVRVVKSVEALRKKIENEKDASREAERELFAAMARRSELESLLVGLRGREELLVRERESFKSELAEAGALIGRTALEYDTYTPRLPAQAGDSAGRALSQADMFDEPRGKQEERRRKLERMKIRLEETGMGNGNEILKEHKETIERDEFLARELTDLEASTEKLNHLIEELTETLETRFVNGINKINKEFDSFFKLMFGGGNAALTIVKDPVRVRPRVEAADLEDQDSNGMEDVEVEEGIDINVSLPHKRVKGLNMLSGGERALTSIALIFAMSQVNPPPFLILDETDAALDEANSRRYGDMIENLAKKSQLILITHNRETMSHAGVLYGVTMGNDGVSKLLSVNFEEAAAVAK